MAKTKVHGEFLKDSVVRFTAKAGENITKGQAVYISGISGEVPIVSLADADDTAKMPAFGLAEATVSTNAEVEITSFGTLKGLDTSSYSLGDILYVDTTAGSLTNNPSGLEATKLQNIGMVQRVHASSGSIKVGGAGRTNAVPNLDDGDIFIGDSNNKAVSNSFTNVLNSEAGISSSADATAITIDSSENVGIGITSPSTWAGDLLQTGTQSLFGQLDTNEAAYIVNNIAYDGSNWKYITTGTASIYAQDHSDSNSHIWYTVPSGIAGANASLNERMRISNAGNVGIGETNPSDKLSVNSGTAHCNVSFATATSAGYDSILSLTAGTSGGVSILNLGYDGDTDYSQIYRGGTSLIFNNNNAERMRIDSSGNLLVGKTSADNTTAGTRIHPAGYASFTIANDYPIIANRLSSDGDIAVFRKDGSTVGSIGTEGTDLTIGSGGAALQFLESENRIRPWNMSTNGGSDNVMDLGRSSQRFNDLYLGGGVYLGGTGSANYLDDYEEGSWTPQLSNGTSMGSNSATYTKIGNLVTVRFDLTNGSGSGTDRIYGLPFDTVGHGSFHITWNNIGNANYIGGYSNSGDIQLIQSGTTSSWTLPNGNRILGFGIYYTSL